MRSAQPQRSLKALALAACLFPAALLAWRLAVAPGWDLTDEAATLGQWQLLREGLRWSWDAGYGNLHRALGQLALRALGGGLAPLRGLALGVHFVTAGLLFALARRHFGAPAALGALICAFAAALPAVHLGSLISPQLLPLLWLLGAWGALEAERPWTQALWGAFCAAALLDYEGWALALPGLALLAWAAPGGRARLGWGLLGFAPVAAGVLWGSSDQAAAYLEVRSAYSGPGSQSWDNLIRHLGHYFWGGGRALPTQGVAGGAAQYPWWSLPFLLLALAGLARRDTTQRLRLALAAAACFPFTVFILYAPAVPSQRVLAAWPPMALLAGGALAAAWGARRWAAWALGAWVLGGMAWEARNFEHALRDHGPRFYGDGGALLKAAEHLQGQGPLELLNELDAEPRGDLRLALNRPEAALGQGRTVALIPWQSAGALARGKGLWTAWPAGPDRPPVLLYAPAPEEADELRQAHLQLRRFWASTGLRPRTAALREATAQPLANRWVRDALWEARFLEARRAGRPEAREGELSQRLGLLRVDPLLRQARDEQARDPALAERLLRAAVARDSRRREAWRQLRALLQAQGRLAELAALDAQLDALPGATYEPFWLVEPSK